jgi:hypothetical protein
VRQREARGVPIVNFLRAGMLRTIPPRLLLQSI